METAALAIATAEPAAVIEWLESQGLTMAAPPQERRAAVIAVLRAMVLQPPTLEQWAALAEAAEARGRLDLAAMFRLPQEPPGQAIRPALDRELLEKPVGQRVALARRASVNMMERLVFDHDPRVIEALLASPRVAAQAVLRIATRRPLPEAVARTILASDRWSCHYGVLRALARNETLDDRWGVAVSMVLGPKDLEAMAGDPKATPTRRRVGRFRMLASHGAPAEVDAPLGGVFELDPLAGED